MHGGVIGVLRPEQPLRLRPGEVVRLIVVRESEPSRWALPRLAALSGGDDERLAEAGLERWTDDLDSGDQR
jgi:predicted DNA-binding antitoxin AbrB/MazE fold protein